MNRVRHGFFPGSGRTHEKQRLFSRSLDSHGLSEPGHGSTLAKQRTIDTTARIAQKCFGDAQFLFERRRPLSHARFKGGICRPKRFCCAATFLV
jgi:hypothetical protein